MTNKNKAQTQAESENARHIAQSELSYKYDIFTGNSVHAFSETIQTNLKHLNSVYF